MKRIASIFILGVVMLGLQSSCTKDTAKSDQLSQQEQNPEDYLDGKDSGAFEELSFGENKITGTFKDSEELIAAIIKSNDVFEFQEGKATDILVNIEEGRYIIHKAASQTKNYKISDFEGFRKITVCEHKTCLSEALKGISEELKSGDNLILLNNSDGGISILFQNN